MSPTVLRVAGVAVGAVTMVAVGAATGSWWWIAASVGAASAVGAVVDRQLELARALSTLALVVGLGVADRAWLVPVLVAGSIGAVELLAAADRITIVRPSIDVSRLPVTVLGAAGVSAAVLAVAQLPAVLASAATIVAAAGAVVATRVIAR